jgi:hypothetical protein
LAASTPPAGPSAGVAIGVHPGLTIVLSSTSAGPNSHVSARSERPSTRRRSDGRLERLEVEHRDPAARRVHGLQRAQNLERLAHPLARAADPGPELLLRQRHRSRCRPQPAAEAVGELHEAGAGRQITARTHCCRLHRRPAGQGPAPAVEPATRAVELERAMRSPGEPRPVRRSRSGQIRSQGRAAAVGVVVAVGVPVPAPVRARAEGRAPGPPPA